LVDEESDGNGNYFCLKHFNFRIHKTILGRPAILSLEDRNYFVLGDNVYYLYTDYLSFADEDNNKVDNKEDAALNAQQKSNLIQKVYHILSSEDLFTNSVKLCEFFENYKRNYSFSNKEKDKLRSLMNEQEFKQIKKFTRNNEEFKKIIAKIIIKKLEQVKIKFCFEDFKNINYCLALSYFVIKDYNKSFENLVKLIDMYSKNQMLILQKEKFLYFKRICYDGLFVNVLELKSKEARKKIIEIYEKENDKTFMSITFKIAMFNIYCLNRILNLDYIDIVDNKDFACTEDSYKKLIEINNFIEEDIGVINKTKAKNNNSNIFLFSEMVNQLKSGPKYYYYFLGLAFLQNEKLSEAISQFKKALHKIHYGNCLACVEDSNLKHKKILFKYLARIYYKLGKITEALYYYKSYKQAGLDNFHNEELKIFHDIEEANKKSIENNTNMKAFFEQKIGRKRKRENDARELKELNPSKKQKIKIENPLLELY